MILEMEIKFGIRICMVLGWQKEWQDNEGNWVREDRKY